MTPDGCATGGSWHCTTGVGAVCDGTVWNRFDAPSDGLFTCNTFGSSVTDTVLRIYRGTSLDRLVELAANDDVDGTTHSRLSFSVEEGERYYVRILSDPVEYRPTRLDYEFLDGALPGDVNGDHAVNLLDVATFVDLIGNRGGYVPTADVNFDGDINLLDVGPFVDLLAN